MPSIKKLLLIGPFPNGKSKVVYGGQLTICKALLNSDFQYRYKLRTIDTTQKTNPPQNIIPRTFYALIRMTKMIFILIKDKPSLVILFFADGFSAVEKGIMAYIASKFGAKTILLPRSGKLITQCRTNSFFSYFIKYIFSKGDIIFVQGQKFKTFFQTECSLQKEKCLILPNWTATEEFLSLGREKSYPPKTEGVTILYLGWVEESKGIVQLIHAARLLKDRGFDFTLNIAGDGSARVKIESLVAQWELADHVKLCGWADNEKRKDLFRNAEIFVLPSFSEGLPNAMVEAMSAGLAPVVTNVGVISDFVTEGSQALIIKPGDVLEMTEAIATLITNHEMRIKISRRAHELASNTFNQQKGVDRFSSYIDSLLAFESHDVKSLV